VSTPPWTETPIPRVPCPSRPFIFFRTRVKRVHPWQAEVSLTLFRRRHVFPPSFLSLQVPLFKSQKNGIFPRSAGLWSPHPASSTFGTFSATLHFPLSLIFQAFSVQCPTESPNFAISKPPSHSASPVVDCAESCGRGCNLVGLFSPLGFAFAVVALRD